MKESNRLALCIGIIVASCCTGCAFHVGVDWNGKTGINNQTVTPDFVHPASFRRPIRGAAKGKVQLQESDEQGGGIW